MFSSPSSQGQCRRGHMRSQSSWSYCWRRRWTDEDGCLLKRLARWVRGAVCGMLYEKGMDFNGDNAVMVHYIHFFIIVVLAVEAGIFLWSVCTTIMIMVIVMLIIIPFFRGGSHLWQLHYKLWSIGCRWELAHWVALKEEIKSIFFPCTLERVCRITWWWAFGCWSLM